MEIVVSDPPLMDQIDAKFKVSGKPVIFAWNGKIYNPQGIYIPVQLIAHEKIHSDRQDNNPEGWWAKYIVDDEFRFFEELEAHLQELKVFEGIYTDRNVRARYKHNLAVRLSSALYLNVVSYPDVMRILNV